MSDFIFRPLVYLGLTFAALFVAWCVVGLIVALSADAKCLASGYPESRITWHMRAYCMNLDGSVTVTVEELR